LNAFHLIASNFDHNSTNGTSPDLYFKCFNSVAALVLGNSIRNEALTAIKANVSYAIWGICFFVCVTDGGAFLEISYLIFHNYNAVSSFPVSL
jgi:hypothetical protein